MSNPEAAKSALRREIKSRLATMTPDQRVDASTQACMRILELEEFAGARAVMLYLAFGTELNIDSLLAQGLDDGKRIVVPRVDWASQTMDLVQVTSIAHEDLFVDERGIRTPRAGTPIAPDEIDLIVTPGLAFDASGHRLGRSGGFYDRLLEGLSSTMIRVGVAFEGQIVERVPIADHDQRVGIVATDTRLIRVKR